MKLQIKVNPQTNIIEDAKLRLSGCGSGDCVLHSLVHRVVKGRTMGRGSRVKNTEIVKERPCRR